MNLKKFLFFILLCFAFKSVNAIEVNGAYYYSPSNVGFYNNYSLTSHDYMGGTFSSSTGAFESNVLTNLGGNDDYYGADICVQLDSALTKNYLYTATLLMANSSDYAYDIASGSNYAMLRGGYIISTAINNADSITLNYFMSTHTTRVVGSLLQNAYLLNYIFIPNNNYNIVCFPFKTTLLSNKEHYLLGIHLEVVGNTVGLTASEVNSLLGTAISDLYSSLGSDISGVESSINNNINDTRSSINNTISNSTNQIDNTITDNTIDNPSSDISDFESYLASNSTITSLLTLPITLFTKVLDSLNATCSNYDLGEFRGTHIILPCINISNYIGSTLFNVIDVLISGLFVYKISRKFINVFEHMSSMKDGDIIDG